MGLFFSYVFLGLSLSAPIGPINAAQLEKGIRFGFFHAWLFGIGAIMADALYMILVFFGIVHFVEIPFMKSFLFLFGFFLLMYTGVESLFHSKTDLKRSESNDSPLLKTFGTGFLIAIANPLTALFWLGIFGSIIAKTAESYDRLHVLLFSCAIFIGILLWDLIMAAAGSGAGRYLNDRLLSWITVLSGLSLIGYGIYFGYQAWLTLFPS